MKRHRCYVSKNGATRGILCPARRRYGHEPTRRVPAKIDTTSRAHSRKGAHLMADDNGAEEKKKGGFFKRLMKLALVAAVVGGVVAFFKRRKGTDPDDVEWQEPSATAVDSDKVRSGDQTLPQASNEASENSGESSSENGGESGSV
jgi:hypothetical protein